MCLDLILSAPCDANIGGDCARRGGRAAWLAEGRCEQGESRCFHQTRPTGSCRWLVLLDLASAAGLYVPVPLTCARGHVLLVRRRASSARKPCARIFLKSRLRASVSASTVPVLRSNVASSGCRRLAPAWQYQLTVSCWRRAGAAEAGPDPVPGRHGARRRGTLPLCLRLKAVAHRTSFCPITTRVVPAHVCISVSASLLQFTEEALLRVQFEAASYEIRRVFEQVAQVTCCLLLCGPHVGRFSPRSLPMPVLHQEAFSLEAG